MTSYKIEKVITNNIVKALDINNKSVILIGKGIGFGKKSKDIVSSAQVENLFVLQEQDQQNLYERLIKTTSPKLIELTNDCIDYIQNHVDKPLNEHIHIALTDHIAFMVRRCKMGVPISNPFDIETANLYPKEAYIANHVVKYLSDALNLRIPESECGFITLHIISATSTETFATMRKVTLLTSKITKVIEEYIMYPIDKTNLNYTRLCTHIRFAIERIQRGERMKVPVEFEEIFKNRYPECYALAYKLVVIMQNELKKNIYSSEIIYLAIHLYRFINAS